MPETSNDPRNSLNPSYTLKHELSSIIKDIMNEYVSALQEQFTKHTVMNLNLILSSHLESESKAQIQGINCLFGGDKEKRCKSIMYTAIERMVQALKTNNVSQSIQIALDFIKTADQEIKRAELESKTDKKKKHCKTDWVEMKKIMERQLITLQSLAALVENRTPFQSIQGKIFIPPQGNPKKDILELDPECLYINIIKPLSKPIRVKLMLEMFKGKKRFKDYEEALNIEGGHLLYHLKPLIKAGLVRQDKDKNYFLTTKGVLILHSFANISPIIREGVVS